jgi:CRP-like cAMP-binding protein
MLGHVSNGILSLLPDVSATLRTRLTPVSLPPGTPLYSPYEPPKFGHFLTSGIASVITSMRDGSCAETGMWGNEGLAECMHLGDSRRVPSRCFMQVGGTALRMPFAELEAEYFVSEELRATIEQTIRTQYLILGQLTACNRLHEAEPRLARWLLTLCDRLNEDSVAITQEFLADMLGSRRTTVTAAAGALQRSGLIAYHRGRLRILDHAGLEHAACECYAVIEKLSQARSPEQSGWGESLIG